MLAMTTFAVYSQVQDHDFLGYDDPDYVTNNGDVQAGLTIESAYWAFTTPHSANWHPMTWLSHMLDYELYGPHPKGHHLTNVFFHITNAILLFMVFLRMTGALWKSIFVAALFALHPLNIESVAWVSQRKSVLSTFFWFLTIWAYIRYSEKPTVMKFGLVALVLALGLMSKPMLVTLPFVLLLLDYWPLGRWKPGKQVEIEQTDSQTSISRLIWEKVPLFALVVGSSITTLIVQKMDGALQSTEFIPMHERITNALVSYLLYLKKMIWPSDLSVFYAHPENELLAWKGHLSAALLIILTAWIIRLARSLPYLAVGWFWYLGTLVPVIGIVQVGAQAMADRYAYVPLIGIFIIVAWGLPELVARWSHKSKVLALLAAIYIPVLMATTWNQVSHWKNSITLFKHAIIVTDKEYPGFALAYGNLGSALYNEQRTEEAISHFKKAIKLNPDYAEPYNHFGIVLFNEQKIEEAISYFKRAIRLKPDLVDAYNNLGSALFVEKRFEEAVFYYTIAIKMNPDFALAHNNLGLALAAERKMEEAIFHFKKAVKIKPDYIDAQNNLKIASRRLRRKED